MAKDKKQPGVKAPGFIVKSPLMHDGKLYAEGELLDLHEEAAASLLENGTLSRNVSEDLSDEQD